jgi:hypothetical protein
MGAHGEGRDRAGEAERPTQPGSGSSGKSRSCGACTRERSHMPAVVRLLKVKLRGDMA